MLFTLLLAVAPIRAELVFDLPHRAGTWECYSAAGSDNYDLRSIHASELQAVAACQNLKAEDLGGDYRVRMSGYLEIVITSNAEAQSVVAAPEVGPPPAPPTSGGGISLGATTVCTANESAGVYTLTANGGGDPDNGCLFELQTITGSGTDRQVSFRVSSITGSTHDFAFAGMQSRAGTAGADVLTQLAWPNVQGCRAKYRDVTNDPWTGGILGDIGATLPHYCAQVYNAGFPRVEWYYSATGGTNPADWTLISTHAVSQGTGKDYLYCANGGAAEPTATCVIDNVSLDTFLIDTQPSEPPINPTNPTYGTEFDLTDNTSTNEGWPTSFPAIREGMSWAMPPTTTPATGSGVFLNSENVPSYYEGNLLKKCNWNWDDFEPTNDSFSWTAIENDLLDSGYDGCMVNIRGVVTEIDDCNGTPIDPGGVTAPSWLTSPTILESCHSNDFRIRNLDIANATVKAEREEFISTLLNTSRAALGNQTVCEHPKFIASIIHGVSNSKGEEWTGNQAGQQDSVDAQFDYIDEIVTACASDTKKFAWLKEVPRELYDHAVLTNGTGWRGGSIENFMRPQYTGGNVSGSNPSTSVLNCQEYTNGYLVFSASCPVVDEGRHYQDQAEAYRNQSSGGPANWPRNYRMAALRIGQMRRNVAWLDNDLAVNPRLSNWLAVSQLGKSLDGASGWVLLGRGYTYWGGGVKEVLNFERGLLQRETYGATTYLDQADCCRVDLNDNPTGNGNLPAANWVWDNARLPPNNGLNINYDNAGVPDTVTQTIQESGDVRTLYVNLTGFRASAAPGNDDFDISGMGIEVERRFIDDTVSSGAQNIVMKVVYYDKTFSGKVPIIFIEIIRCGGSYPACT